MYVSVRMHVLCFGSRKAASSLSMCKCVCVHVLQFGIPRTCPLHACVCVCVCVRACVCYVSDHAKLSTAFVCMSARVR
jgi:hypothetical protein